MKYRKKKLYVLMENDNDISAMSENADYIIKYRDQFPDYFKEDNCRIIEVINTGYINDLICKYNDRVLECLTGSIIVTHWELEYYDKQLRSSYKDTKTMMSQMIVMIKMSTLSVTEKCELQRTFDMLYGHIKSYDDYLKKLDCNQVMETYIMDPGTCRAMIKLDKEYKNAVDNDI